MKDWKGVGAWEGGSTDWDGTRGVAAGTAPKWRQTRMRHACELLRELC